MLKWSRTVIFLRLIKLPCNILIQYSTVKLDKVAYRLRLILYLREMELRTMSIKPLYPTRRYYSGLESGT